MIKEIKQLTIGDIFNISEGPDYSGNIEGHFTIIDKDNQLKLISIQPYYYIMEVDEKIFILSDAGNGNFKITNIVDIELVDDESYEFY